MDVKYEPPRDFLVRKGGYFYRPNAQGYTANPAEAGRFTFSEAWDHSHPNGEDGPRDGITFIHESEIDEPAQTALTTAQSEAAELRKEVERKDARIKQLATVLHGVGGLLETNVRTKARDDHAEQKMVMLIRAALTSGPTT